MSSQGNEPLAEAFSSSSSGTRGSFHSARTRTDTNMTSSVDEIHTAIGSSILEASEISSVIFGQVSRAGDTTSYGSDSFITEGKETESSYSTAQSSFVSRSESETYFTATSRSDCYSQTQSRSSFYTDEFESEQPSTTSKDDYTLESDLADSTDAERQFIKSRLFSLKGKRRGDRLLESYEAQADKIVEENQKTFVSGRLSLLQKKTLTGHSNIHENIPTQEKSDSRFSDVTISRGLVDKLRIDNLLHSMRKVCEEPIHEPDKCTRCRKQQSAVREKDFAREKHRHVYNKLTEDKYRLHVVTNDPVSEIGRLASELPKLSDDPRMIWDQLLQKGVT